jgi:hypothetical protein
MSKLSHSRQEYQVETWLKVDSFAELMQHEKEIIDRVELMPNGGHLFLIHPFLLLRDIGVELSEGAELEIRRYEPRLTGLSIMPYDALKFSKEEQNVRFHLRGLFERKEKP